MPGNQGRGSVQEAAERRLKAWEHYKNGKTYREIGKILGVSHTQVAKYIKQELAELAELRREISTDYVEAELARLDELLHAFKEKSDQGDTKAADVIIKIMDRRAKYLGLNAPEKHDISGKISISDLIQQSHLDET